MRRYMHLAFDTELGHVQSIFGLLRLVFQPVSSPANEIRRKQDECLLKIDGRFATHLEVMKVEHLLALFNPGLNRLPTVVLLEPPRQLLGHWLSTEVKQSAVLEGFAG